MMQQALLVNAQPPTPLLRPHQPGQPVTPAYIAAILTPDILISIPENKINTYVSVAVAACLTPAEKEQLSKMWAQLQAYRTDLQKRQAAQKSQTTNNNRYPVARPAQLPTPPPAVPTTQSPEPQESNDVVATMQPDVPTSPPPSETRTIALGYKDRYKLIARPPTLQDAILKAASPSVFNLTASALTLQVQVGNMWYDVLEETWGLAALSAMDPMPLRVSVAAGAEEQAVEPNNIANAPVTKLDMGTQAPPAKKITLSMLPKQSARTSNITTAPALDLPESPSSRSIVISVQWKSKESPIVIRCKPTTLCDAIWSAVMSHLRGQGELYPESTHRLMFDTHDVAMMNTIGALLDEDEDEITMDLIRGR
ncbi:hypothetical protein P7C70_g4844, partial [Phenoliferia sp. Uapishka_3]